MGIVGTDVAMLVTCETDDTVTVNGEVITPTLVTTNATQALSGENTLLIFSGWVNGEEETGARGEYKFYSLKIVISSPIALAVGLKFYSNHKKIDFLIYLKKSIFKKYLLFFVLT